MTVVHRTPEELERGLEEIRSSPKDVGTISLIVRRPAENMRELLEEARLDPREGLVGDTWLADYGDGHEPDAHEWQLTLMNVRVAELVAVDPERRALAGDQIYVDFDLSEENCPAGTRLALGDAVVEVSAVPHTGCAKFVERFGRDAMIWVNSPVGRSLRLRGINARIVTPGSVRVGDSVRRVQRDDAPSTPSDSGDQR